MQQLAREFQLIVVLHLESDVLIGALMNKLMGVLFLAARPVLGFKTWRIRQELGDHNTSMLLLIVGVKLMRGQNPIKEMWCQSQDDEDEAIARYRNRIDLQLLSAEWRH